MVGMLKARVSGAWVNLPVGGATSFPGGVAGDVLVKNSATTNDALWGISLPKLNLTSTVDVSLSSTTHALTLGDVVGQNLGLYRSGIQSRNNGAIANLNLNYFGGQVVIGGGQTGQYANMLRIEDSAHATSRRATLVLGSGWEIGQDFIANGVKDLYFYNVATGNRPLTVSADGTIIDIGRYAGSTLRLGSTTTDCKVYIGDDAYFSDLNTAHVIGLRSNTNVNYGFLGFGTGANKIGYDGEMRVLCSGAFTVTANNFQALNAAGSAWYFNHDGNRFWTPKDIVCDTNITASGAMYASNWFRARGSSGFYCEDYGIGLRATAANILELYGAGVFSLMGGTLRFYNNRDDNNHRLQYSSATPTGSGEANNGPLLVGYASVWLSTMQNKNFYLASNGNVHINAGCTYNVFSSREHKTNIIPIDPEESLEMVRKWLPVEFDLIEDGGHREGFISEDHAEVTPAMVNICAEDSLRPGWANAVDYGAGTIRLTGAVQALLKRIEKLEEMAA